MTSTQIQSWPSLVFAVLVTVVLAGCGGGTDQPSEAERMAEEHEGDTPVATEAAQRPAIPVEGRTVSYGQLSGDSLTGYLAVPANVDSVLSARGMDPETDALPGLVVIHEWWGLNDNIRAATRRLAGEGYRALAVDLYGDAVAQTPDSAQALMGQAMEAPARLVSNVETAHDYLLSNASTSRLAVLGWCFGGGMTYRTLANLPSAFDAAVAYYGTPSPLSGEALQAVDTPILAHFGTQDQAVTIEVARDFRDRMNEAGKALTYHEYDAGHAFANPSGEQYDPAAADSAWARTTEFLQMHLYPEGE